MNRTVYITMDDAPIYERLLNKFAKKIKGDVKVSFDKDNGMVNYKFRVDDRTFEIISGTWKAIRKRMGA